MYWKITFDSCYYINSTVYLLKFGKLYGTLFCYRLAVSERVHIFEISFFLVRAHQEVQGGCHHSIRPRCFEVTVQGGCCTTVVVQNDIQIHQQKRRKAYLYMQ